MKEYVRRSGVVIRDTEADKALLEVIDSGRETMRDLALVSACISEASPKLFAYLKAEAHQGKPNIKRINEILNFLHPELNQEVYWKKTPVERAESPHTDKMPDNSVTQQSVTTETPAEKASIEHSSESDIKNHDFQGSLSQTTDAAATVSDAESSLDEKELMPMLVTTNPVKRRSKSGFKKL